MDSKLRNLILHNFPDASRASSENEVLKLFEALEKQIAWLKDNYEPGEGDGETPTPPADLTVTSPTAPVNWDSGEGPLTQVVVEFDRNVSVDNTLEVTAIGGDIGTVSAVDNTLTITFDPAIVGGDVTVTIGVDAVSAVNDGGKLTAPVVIVMNDTVGD